MKNKDRETIFIFSSDNGAVQIFNNPDKVRAIRTLLPKSILYEMCLEIPLKNKYPNGVAADGTPDPALERTGCNYPNKGLKDCGEIN